MLTTSALIGFLLSMTPSAVSFSPTHKSAPATRLSHLSLSIGGDKFMPPSMEDRLRKGIMTAADLTRAFGPSKRDMDTYARLKYAGALGVVFSLEAVLVDMREAFKYAYSILAEDLREDPLSDPQVYDVIGLPFSESMSALQWAVPKESLLAVETRFSTILAKICDAIPLKAYDGAVELLDDLLRANNEVAINTFMSRELAIKAISKAGLSSSLEGRLGPDRLVHPSLEYAVTRRGQQLLRCCGVMTKPPILSVSVDANYRTILDAKRDGLSAVAIKGLATNAYQLRSADKIFDRLSSLKAIDLSHIVERAAKQEEGPQQQTEEAADRNIVRLKSVSAPAQFEDERPRDTFADEKGADTL